MTARSTCFVGGQVLPCDGTTRRQEAIVIRDGVIAGLAGRDDMLTLAGSDAEIVEVDGATVLPGLIDTHPHAMHFASRRVDLVDIKDAASHDDIIERIRRRAEQTAAGEWIMTTPVGEPDYFISRNYRHLEERRLPDRDALDRATDRHPVFIQAWAPTTPGICAFNSAGLAAVGITSFTPERVCDVMIEKDHQGRPTGIVRGSVNNYYNLDPYWTQIQLKMPMPWSFELHDSTVAEIADYNSWGVTCLYEGHAMVERHIDAYLDLRRDNRLSARVLLTLEAENTAISPLDPLSMDDFVDGLRRMAQRLDASDDRLKIDGLTFTVGLVAEPGLLRSYDFYTDPYGQPTRGVDLLSRDKLFAFAAFCAENDIRANFVTCGYRDNDDVIAAIEAVDPALDVTERSWLIQHAIVISPQQARRFHELGCDMTTCLSFPWGEGALHRDRIGAEVLRDLVPLKRLRDSGLTVGCGSDWGPKNAWKQIRLATTHEFEGEDFRNDGPDHVVSREDSLMTWTRDAARVLGWPGIGSLARGNHADLIVVDRDPVECDIDDLPDTKVLRTVVGGETVYDAGLFG